MRKFAHITKNDNKVVNIFEWGEEIDPNLGENNLLLDITNLSTSPGIGDLYNSETEEFVLSFNSDLALPLEELKFRKISEVKNLANGIITASDKYPLYRQLNYALGIKTSKYSSEKKADMISFIENIIDKSDKLEEQINACTDNQSILDTKIEFLQ